MTVDKRRCIIVSGLSGAGKSVVLNTLEDLDYYCIDNLPVTLLRQFGAGIEDRPADIYSRVAVGIDARSPEDDLSALPDIIAELRGAGTLAELVFMEADTEVLTKRFSETRRKHPLTRDKVSLAEAINRERSVLGGLAETADLRIDTSRTSVHELRELVRNRIAERQAGGLAIQLLSFGYKHGTPRDADFVFDVRCLPNPHWQKELRRYSGLDRPVIEYLEEQQAALDMLADLRRFLNRWIPEFEKENRSYLSIAVGCTGGHHRSVYMVEQLAAGLREGGCQILVRHRDL